MRVLVVDDDPGFLRYSELALEEAGIAYEAAIDAAAARQALEGHLPGHFDVILLDVEMPGVSGWEFLATLREEGTETPVIFVTGHEEVEQRVRGLRLGADDYIVKPFDFAELVARLEAVLRRRGRVQIEIGDMRLDLARRRLELSGQEIGLSPREFEILTALVMANGRVLSRAELQREVGRVGNGSSTSALEVHVARLRKKLRGGGRPSIETVRGQGYRLAIPQAPGAQAEPPAARPNRSPAGS